jgi:hypothetical protein
MSAIKTGIIVVVLGIVCRTAEADFCRFILDLDATTQFDWSFDNANGIDLIGETAGGTPVPGFVEFNRQGVSYSSQSASLTFEANPFSSELNPGTYLNATRPGPGTNPKFDFSFNGSGFNQIYSSFTITQETLRTGPNGPEFQTFVVDFNFNFVSPTAPPTGSGEFFFNIVPEPSTLALLALGALGLLARRQFAPLV